MGQDCSLEQKCKFKQENLHVLRLHFPFRRLEYCVFLVFIGLSRHGPMNLPIEMQYLLVRSVAYHRGCEPCLEGGNRYKDIQEKIFSVCQFVGNEMVLEFTDLLGENLTCNCVISCIA
jgi:hypothetical protein